MEFTRTMAFDLDKKNILSRLDKSKKGEVDVRIKRILAFINAKKDYYTTSSCSGRILILETKEGAKKNEVKWLLNSHEKINLKQINESLSIIKEDAWLKEESAILHIACRDLASAEKLLRVVRDCGLKRSGIIALGKRIILEIINTDSMATILAKKGKLLVDQKHLQCLVQEANKKLESNFKKLKKLEKAIVHL